MYYSRDYQPNYLELDENIYLDKDEIYVDKLMQLNQIEKFVAPEDLLFCVLAHSIAINESSDVKVFEHADKLTVKQYLSIVMDILNSAIKSNKRPVLYHAFERANVDERTILDTLLQRHHSYQRRNITQVLHLTFFF